MAFHKRRSFVAINYVITLVQLQTEISKGLYFLRVSGKGIKCFILKHLTIFFLS